MRLFFLCQLIAQSVEIPKCPEPELNQGTKIKCPTGRKNGGRCTTFCEQGWKHLGRSFPITCRCMRTAKGIKCSFNQEPTLCAKESGGIVNPAGIMIAKPTIVAPTQSGRQVYRPPGQTGPKVVNKPKNNVSIGGFNDKTPRQFGTAHKRANKVDVDSGIQQQLLALQQQILAMAPVTTKAPPPTVNINPSLVVQPNFQAVNQINTPPPMNNNLAACGAPQTTGRFMSVDSWETGFMGKIEVDINTMSTGWSVVVSFAEPIPVGNVQVFNARYTEISRDSKNILFTSKSSLDGSSTPLPNFGFVFTEMPSWSKKPIAGGVLYFNEILFNENCISGAAAMMGVSNSIPSISMQPSQPVSAFKPTPPPAPIMVTMPAPATTPRRQLSLMERLATRNAVKTTPSPVLMVTAPFVPSNEYAQEIDPNRYRASQLPTEKQKKICNGQVFGSFEKTNSWNETPELAGTTANVKLPLTSNPSADFKINAQFGVPVDQIEVWMLEAKPTKNKSLWVFTPKSGYSYNMEMDFSVNIIAETNDPANINAIIVFCDEASGVEVDETSQSGGGGYTQRPAPGKDVLYNILSQGGEDAFDHQNRHSENDRDVTELFKKYKAHEGEDRIRRFPPQPRCIASNPAALKPLAPRQTVPQCPAADETLYKYNMKEVICLSRLFYEAQRVGFNPSKDIPWRGVSGMKHGCDRGKDLTGGWYDGGDNIVFVFPLAHTVAMLAWSLIDFKQGFESARQFKGFVQELKWGTDFLIKAHISKFEMVGLIGNPEADHKKWVRPEDPDAAGTPSYTITANKPGTELAAEAAAALAAASLVYSWAEMNTYAKLCLKHAMELFEFANTHRGFYHDSIPQVYDFYRSWEGYDDELAWAAIWLFGATEEKTFLDKAKSFYSQGGKTNRKPFNWDNKWPGVRVLIARLNKDDLGMISESQHYIRNLIKFKKYTPKGLLYLEEWGSLRLAANTAYLALVTAKLDPDSSDDLLQFAKDQLYYMYGSSGRSFIVGFGQNSPKRAHHRSSSCPVPPQACGWAVADDQANPNTFIIHGALVGGPDRLDGYKDNRKEYKQTEVTIDYNAGFTGATAGLLYYIELNYISGL